MPRARAGSVFWVAVLVALAALVPPAAAREKEPATPSAAAEALLERQGFAVEDGHASRLSAAYRWATGPVFVTADSGLAAYLLCLRKLLIHRGGAWYESAGPLLADWTAALEKSAPGGERDGARVFVALLRRVQDDASADAGLAEEQARELDLERLAAGDLVARVPGLGAPLDRGPVASL